MSFSSQFFPHNLSPYFKYHTPFTTPQSSDHTNNPASDPPSQPQTPVLHGSSEEYITMKEGELMVLECFFSSWPPPNITWEKYGGILPADRSKILSGM